jgi:uncharacterized membrane protein required for colicin V production
MVTFLTVLIMLIVAYAHFREGLFTATTMLVNVVIAGLIAFGFWEPLADVLDPVFAGGFLAGFEDLLALVAIFIITLVILRAITNRLAPSVVDFPGYFQQFGGALVGLLTGYLTAGFLMCVFQTLPWHENFMGFQPQGITQSGSRGVMPPDRVWLAMMRYAGAHALSWKINREETDSAYDRYLTFDPNGTFELRYLRYRRHGDKRGPLKYEGEFDLEMPKPK